MRALSLLAALVSSTAWADFSGTWQGLGTYSAYSAGRCELTVQITESATTFKMVSSQRCNGTVTNNPSVIANISNAQLMYDGGYIGAIGPSLAQGGYTDNAGVSLSFNLYLGNTGVLQFMENNLSSHTVTSGNLIQNLAGLVGHD